MFERFKKNLQIIESYIWGVKLKTYHSPLNGILELWLINNRLVLNSTHANQSFDSMHYIFRKVFSEIDIQHKHVENVLLLGLGCGSIPSILFDELKINCRITAVDHDEMMPQIANEHFNLQRFKNLEVIIQDAIRFVNENTNSYDLIIIDLFYDDTVPEIFLQTSFIQKVSALMNTKGILIFNMITQTNLQKEKFAELHKFFAHAEVIKANGSNSVIVHKRD